MKENLDSVLDDGSGGAGRYQPTGEPGAERAL